MGDNDALAAQVALLVKADLLVLLTDTDGLYTADPREDPDARLITKVEDLGDLACVTIGSASALGRGGMGSKVNSARIATSGGVETITIARGTRPGVLSACLAGRMSARGSRPVRSVCQTTSRGCSTANRRAARWWWTPVRPKPCGVLGKKLHHEVRENLPAVRPGNP